jgi:hypothetical protein
VPAVPERSRVIPDGHKCVLECVRPYLGPGQLVESKPAELQVTFPADRVGLGDGDLEHEVEFVVGAVIVEVAVLNDADEPIDPGFSSKFFGKLADEGDLNVLARLDVAAGQA